MAKDLSFRNSKKQMVVNVISNLLVFVINAGISMLLTPFLISNIGKEAYSFYPISNTIVHYITIIATSLNTVGCRYISISIFQKKNEEANRYYSSMIISDFILSLVLLIPSFIFVLFINKFLDVPVNIVETVRFLFALVLSSAIITILTSAFGVATMAKNRMDLRSYRELFISILRVSLLFAFYKLFSPSLIFIGVAAVACSLTMAGIQFAYTRYLTPNLRFSFHNCSSTHIKEICIASIWVTINSLGTLMLSGTTIVIANVFYGPSSSGTLSICLTVPNLLTSVISLLVSVFYPILAHSFVTNSKEEFASKIQNVQKLIGALGCAITTVFCVFSIHFFKLWTPKENSGELAMYTYILFSQYLAVSCFWVLTNVFIICNKNKIAAIATIIAGALNIVVQICFSFFDAPLFFLPLTSSLLCILLCSVFMPIYASKVVDTKCFPFIKPFIICFLVSLFVGTGGYFISFFSTINSWLMFILIAIGYGILVLPIYFFLIIGLDNLKKIVSEIRKNKKGDKIQL
ncbi:MAG: MATE family efflux transporter [Bacilli bacterium]|nr:MATE family efflux transporter [Bacilli bacterium]